MNYRKLGNTSLEVSEIGMGTWVLASQIYGEVPESDALRAIDLALEAGITVFDTAPLYGDKNTDGIAETILGKGLAGRRNDVLIASKFGRYSSDGAAPHFHAQRARESVEGSLKRLGTDHLDILFFHSPFSPADIHDDVWEELGKLKDEGKIRVVGHSISMFWDTEQMAREWASERKIEAIQVVLSLMNRESTQLIHDLGAQGIGIFARESMANGFLSGKITKDYEFPKGTLNARYSPEEIAARVDYADELTRLLVRDDIHSLPQAATRWVLDQPHISLVLSGAKNEAELQDWIHASQAKPYSEAELAETKRIHIRDFQAA